MRGVLGRLAGVLIFLGFFWVSRQIIDAHESARFSTGALIGFVAWLIAAYLAGMVVHELGHASAVRLVGSRVDGIQFGANWLRFTVGGVPVSVGLGLGGHVSFASHRVSPQRRAAVLFAGPLANLLVAPLCLLLPVPGWQATYIALCVLPTALQDLVPGNDASDGSFSDGSQLARIPATMRASAAVRALLADPDWLAQPGAADTLLNGFRLDVAAAEDCLRELTKQPARMLALYRQEWTLPDRPEPDFLHITDVLTWKVLCTGELPPPLLDLAASRAEWMLDHLPRDSDDKRIALHKLQPTLALARLRQGRTLGVRRLCAGALAAKLDPDDRASVLAIVAMTKHARLLSGQAELDEAVALDPEASLVTEAVLALGREPAVLTRNADAVMP